MNMNTTVKRFTRFEARKLARLHAAQAQNKSTKEKKKLDTSSLLCYTMYSEWRTTVLLATKKP